VSDKANQSASVGTSSFLAFISPPSVGDSRLDLATQIYRSGVSEIELERLPHNSALNLYYALEQIADRSKTELPRRLLPAEVEFITDDEAPKLFLGLSTRSFHANLQRINPQRRFRR
jgi:hypothetical protein